MSMYHAYNSGLHRIFRHMATMLLQCWANVIDDGPRFFLKKTLVQRIVFAIPARALNCSLYFDYSVHILDDDD